LLDIDHATTWWWTIAGTKEVCVVPLYDETTVPLKWAFYLGTQA